MLKKQTVASVLVGSLLILMGAGCNTAPEDKNPSPMPPVDNALNNDQPAQQNPGRLDTRPNQDDDQYEGRNEKPEGETQATSPEPAPTPAPDTPTVPTTAPAAAQEIVITGKDWKWSPDTIKVKKGTRVRLKITSEDIEHGLALPDFNINVMLEPGKTQVVEFTADKIGTFSFYCSVPCGPGHRTMRGTITVE